MASCARLKHSDVCSTKRSCSSKAAAKSGLSMMSLRRFARALASLLQESRLPVLKASADPKARGSSATNKSMERTRW